MDDYTNRTRGGSEQIFYTGNNERDFDRYRAEGGVGNPNIKMHDKHNICRTCRTPRAEIKGTCWGGKQGWQCGSCHDAEATALRRERLEAVAEKEYDEWDYCNTDRVVCPHCESSYMHYCEPPEGEEECNVCGGIYSVEPEYSVTFTTRVVGERLIIKEDL